MSKEFSYFIIERKKMKTVTKRKKTILLTSALILAVASPASAKTNPFKAVTAGLAIAEVGGAAANQTAKIINPGNNMFATNVIDQYISVNDLYMNQSSARTNVSTVKNSNIGSYSANQYTRLTNVDMVRGSILDGNVIEIQDTTAASIRIDQKARIQGVVLAQSSLTYNHVTQ